jgi:fumarate reductase flavoprotein subunit
MVIVLIALGAAVQMALHADARAGKPGLVAGSGPELSHGFVMTAAQEPKAPGAGKGYLIDKHLAIGLECDACHAEKPPAKEPGMAQCLTCHGPAYSDLAETTAKDRPNPHKNHMGDSPCGTCHHVHSASELFCESCHREFEFKTP